MSGTIGTTAETVEGRVAELARAEASTRGLTVLDVSVRDGRAPTVTVTVDVAVPEVGRLDAAARPSEAVDIDVIAGLSRALDTALVAGGVVPAEATLEVSSPGVERPLATAQDLVRNLGRDVELTVDGTPLRGRLVAVDADSVGVVVDGVEQQVARERVAAARLVLPW